MAPLISSELNFASDYFYSPEQDDGKRRTFGFSVRFSPRVTVFNHIHVNDLTANEIASSWYAKEDYQQLRQDIKTTIRSMLNDPVRSRNDDPDYCTRGLEFKTPSESRRRRGNRQLAMASVLNYQESAWDSGEDFANPNGLAKVYSFHTYISGREAHLMATLDARAAKGIEEEVRDRRTSRLRRRRMSCLLDFPAKT